MHDHEFERQVNRKMEELRLDPSTTVWERVESRLHEKKRRRRLIWLPFLFAGMLLGGYLFMQHRSASGLLARSNNKEQPNIKENNAPSYPTLGKVLPAVKKTDTVAHASPANTQRQKNAQQHMEKLQEGQPLLAGSLHHASIALTLKNNRENTMLSGHRHNTNKVSGSAYSQGGRLAQNKEDKVIPEKSGLQDEAVGRMAEVKNSLNDTTAFQGGDEIMREPVAGTVFPFITEALPNRFAVKPPYKDIATQAINLKKTSRIEWGVALQAMITSVNDGKLHSLFAGSQDSQVASNLFTGPSSSVAASQKPAAVKKGRGFSGGFFLRKQLTRRVAVSTGLNYTLFTTAITTGSSVDSTAALAGRTYVDQFFRVGNNRYINRYHFIELPLAFEWQLSKGRVPFIWETGVSVSRLLASNALHYSIALNGYYTNNQEINHIQLSFLTGLYVQAFSGSKHVIRMGPQLRYGLTTLFTQANQRNHMMQYGLTIGMGIR